MRRPNYIASRYTTERPDQVIPFLPDAPTDVDWTTTTTWDAWADYISQRGKWAGGVECRPLNEVFVQVGSRIRINFISDEHQQIFGTELNSPQTSEKLLLLTSGHFQLLRPLKATDTSPGSQKPTKRSHSEITAPTSNKSERKRTKGGTPKSPSVKRSGKQQQNKKTTQRRKQPEMTPKKASRKTPKKKKRLRKKYTWFT